MKPARKKVLLLPVFLLVTISAFAQIRIGIKGGLNLANMQYEPVSGTNSTSDAGSLLSYNAGFILDMPVMKNLSIQPGLLLDGKGSKVAYNSSNFGSYTTTIDPVYFEIPVNVLLKPQISSAIRFYFGAGPYFAMGFTGRQKFEYENAPVIGSGFTGHNLKFGNNSGDDLKSADMGGNVLAGLEFKSGFLVGAQYSISFTNNAPKNSNTYRTIRNKVLSFSVGYLFRK